jgi:predicted transcriptional regulator of viral defense system
VAVGGSGGLGPRIMGVRSVDPNSSGQSTSPDVFLARLAARQHGVVARAQLSALGIDQRAIEYRLAVGRLHLLHRGVYAVGHRPPSPLATAMAAVLACGLEAFLSHRSAAALWRIVRRWPSANEVSVPGRRRHPGIRVHRSRHAETTVHYGIPTTTPAQTLVDLADVLDDRQLARAVNEAYVHKLTTPHQLSALLTRSPGRRTSRLTPHTTAATPTRSHLEDDFLRFIKRHRLPTPEVKAHLRETANGMPTSSMRGSRPSASPTNA